MKISAKKFMSRCFKIIGILVLSGLLIIQTIQCVTKFISGPTYFSTKYMEQKFSDFPAISICPSGSLYKSDILAAHGIPSKKSYNYKYNLTWSSNDSNTSPIELFHLITYDFNEMVRSIKIRYFKADPVRLKLNLTKFVFQISTTVFIIIRLPNALLIHTKQNN